MFFNILACKNAIHRNETIYLKTNTSNDSDLISSLNSAFPLVTGWMVIYKLYLCLWQQKRVLGHCRLQQIRSTNPPQMQAKCDLLSVLPFLTVTRAFQVQIALCFQRYTRPLLVSRPSTTLSTPKLYAYSTIKSLSESPLEDNESQTLTTHNAGHEPDNTEV